MPLDARHSGADRHEGQRLGRELNLRPLLTCRMNLTVADLCFVESSFSGAVCPVAHIFQFRLMQPEVTQYLMPSHS